MNFNFELILFWLVIITGAIALLDKLFLAKKRGKKPQKTVPWWADYSQSFFPILLIVFLLRAFLFEPFRIPTGSLEPTLLIGDFILVNKFDYGVRLPIMHKKIFALHSPQRGDIMIFRWPPNPSYDFIKRVIGLPGDHISYVNKTLYINGQKIPQEFLQDSRAQDENGHMWQVAEKLETLLTVKHKIYQDPNKSSYDFHDIVVPKDMYFVMGDNRDNSADSRFWGFVPDKNIVGKAIFVWMSWDRPQLKVRWDRIGRM